LCHSKGTLGFSSTAYATLGRGDAFRQGGGRDCLESLKRGGSALLPERLARIRSDREKGVAPRKNLGLGGFPSRLEPDTTIRTRDFCGLRGSTIVNRIRHDQEKTFGGGSVGNSFLKSQKKNRVSQKGGGKGLCREGGALQS